MKAQDIQINEVMWREDEWICKIKRDISIGSSTRILLELYNPLSAQRETLEYTGTKTFNQLFNLLKKTNAVDIFFSAKNSYWKKIK